MATASEVVRMDLDYLVKELGPQFELMSGGRLLVTGGAGFLGYYLLQAPLAWNDRGFGDPIKVIVYDNYWQGVPDWLSNLAMRSDVTTVEHDMRTPLPSDPGRFDYVIHAAGIASPVFYRAHPIETMDANITGLRSLLDMAETQDRLGNPLKGFLFFSSSEIYGDPVPEAIPTPETYRGNVSCTGPRSCYDESKRYGETLCVNFAQSKGISVAVARPFNNFGPGMKIMDGRVVADFCRAIVSNEDIVMFSDGSPRRTYCYVADAVSGYFKILVSGRPGEAYNVGAAAPEISVRGLAETLSRLGRELFGYSGSLILGESPEGPLYLADNPTRRCPDITKAQTALGYRTAYSLEEGLRRTLIWYRENQGGEAR